MHVARRVLIFAYQRTTFVDAFRVAARLQETGLAEPVFLVASETSSLLEQEIAKCKRNGIRCITEEELGPGVEAQKEAAAAPASPPPKPARNPHIYMGLDLWFIERRILWLQRRLRLWFVSALKRIFTRRVALLCANCAATILAQLSKMTGGRLPQVIEKKNERK